MSVPPKLIGAWRRSGVLIDGKRVVDEFDRLWLQTPEWFADVRLRIDPLRAAPDPAWPAFLSREGAFAGVTSWTEPVITWDHRIDVSPKRGGDDSSPLVWADGVLQEHGTTVIGSEPRPFVEEWIRLTGDDLTWAADVSESSARVEVGNWAIEVRDDRPGGQFTATRYERSASGWSCVGALTQ